MITTMIQRSWAIPMPMGIDPSSARVSNSVTISVIFGNSEMKKLKFVVNLFRILRAREWQPTRISYEKRYSIFSRALTALFGSSNLEFFGYFTDFGLVLLQPNALHIFIQINRSIIIDKCLYVLLKR